jgi:hypothetical protein
MFLFFSIPLVINAQILEKIEEIKNMKVLSGSIIQKKRPLGHKFLMVLQLEIFLKNEFRFNNLNIRKLNRPKKVWLSLKNKIIIKE